MKKMELLSPAGDKESLKAAIQAGCDAVYLGGSLFGARAFSKNFNDEEMVEAINYAHLYGVKVYVTVNTLIYENEVNDFINYIEFLHKNNVDALLIQDLGMFDLVRKTFPNLELHASTQMHIHNLDSAKLMESLGIKRIVLARETPIEEIEYIKKNLDCEIEVFVHGALCISYSGQCLMSSFIGGRSGNRGKCAGSCRLKYDIITEDGKKINEYDYPLSTKDLNSLENIGRLIDIGVDSIKIEGRMKSPQYVYMVTKLYRMAIDSYYKNGMVSIDKDEELKLKKIFNREYTKGFLFNTDNNDLINGYRPNHMGVSCCKVIGYNKGIVKIKLNDSIYIGSGLRVIKDDVGINVNEIYVNNKLVKEAHKGDVVSLKVKSDVSINSDVVITLDSNLNKEIDKYILDNERKVPVSITFYAHKDKDISLIMDDGTHMIKIIGKNPEISKNRPVTKEIIEEKLDKLGDTVYKIDNIFIDMDDDLFIPISDINNMRRDAINYLNEKRLYKSNFKKCEYKIDVPDFPYEKKLACLDDYNIYKYDVKDGLEGKVIRKLPRVIKDYPSNLNSALVGEIGGIKKYNNVYTDFSLNVVNSYTVAFLHSLGVKRITLSYELEDKQIKDMIDGYHKRYGKHPNLELIVSGYPEAMICKYSLNKKYKRDILYLRDMFNNKYKVVTKDDLMYIYFYKKIDNYNDKYYDMGINTLRINNDI